MSKFIDVIAVYKMPASLELSDGCFSKNFTVTIAGLTGKATTPGIEWREKGDEPYVTAPSMSPEIEKHVEHYVTNSGEKIAKGYFWGNVSSWHPKKRTVLHAHVRALLFYLKIEAAKVSYSDYLYGRGHPMGKEVDALFKEIDKWFECVRSWVEAATDQDIDPRAPLQDMEMHGEGLHVFTIDKGVVSLPASASAIIVNHRNSERVKLATFRKIIKQANMGALPSDAHILLKESRAARRRGQYRRAVIDAGSATEITLADFNRRVTGLTPRRGALPTLGWYVNQPAIKLHASLPANTKTDLVDVRNGAIHQNQTPTIEETDRVLAIAKQIVDSLDPLPL